MKKGLKKPIALLLSAMMIFSTSASAFPAMAEDNLIFEAENNSIHSDYEFHNSESEITVTTCENEENSTETTTVSTTTEVFVQSSDEQTESNPVEVYNSDYAVYAVSNSDTYEKPKEGDGSESSPYQISNSSQLFWFAKQVNNGETISAVLTADIVVNENIFDENGNLISDLEIWTPIGNESNKYTGTFDGQNHTISGLYFNNDSTDYVGLFGYNNSGTIKNVGIIDSYFKGRNYVGGVCGYNDNGTITNSYNTGSVSGFSYVGGVCGYNYDSNSTIENSYNTGSVSGSSNSVGGICGWNYNGTITNSYNTGSVSGSKWYVGGVCGRNYNGTITNSYNTGSVSALSYVGGVCGNNKGTIENSYNTGSVSGSEKVGGVCGYNYGKIENSYYLENCNAEGTKFTNSYGITQTSEQFANGEVAYRLGGIWGQEIEKDKLPVLNGKKVYENKTYTGCCEKYQGDITKCEYSNIEAGTIYLKEIHNFENGICTGCGTYEPIEPELENGYYQIGNAHHLYWFAKQVNNGETSISAVLTADIVVNENIFDENGNLIADLEIWTPIGTNYVNEYQGIFDGQSHTIKGLYFNNENTDNVGLFGCNSNTIKNIGIIDSFFEGRNYVGSLCGYNKGTITNSYNTSSSVSGASWVGGICGVNHTNSTITNSYNTGSVSSSSVLIGGFCGNNSGKIENSYNIGIVNGKNYVGGFCGNNTGTITKSYYLENCNAEGTKFTNSYGITQTSKQFESGEVAYLLQKEQGTEIWGQKIGKDTLPVLNGEKVYENKTYTGCCEKYQGDITKCEYSNTKADTIYLKEIHNFENGICTGCGTYEPAQLVDNYYQISNAGNLLWFAKQVNNNNTDINAILTADIVVNKNVLNADGTLNSDSALTEWTPIGNGSNHYTGTFDGNNHTISGLYFNDKNTDYVGLFSWNSGTIKNIGIIDSYFSGKGYVGGVCGKNNDTIENSYNSGSVSGSGDNVGGVCGYNEYNRSKIKNSYNTGSVSGSLDVGGVCGSNVYGTIENSYNTGSVSGSGSVGGVCGYNSSRSTIANSYNTGLVSRSGWVGGVCGFNSGKIENSYYNNSVYSGKAVGYDKGTVTKVTGKTSEQFASGEVAYLLGGIWGQKIGKDTLPVLNGEKVYENKTYSGCCEKYQGDVTKEYSNTKADTIYLGNHNFKNGICTGCGTYELIAPEENNGYYQIENVNHLYWFANEVNNGNTKINAVLTADIVVNQNVLNADGTLNTDSTLTEWTPIGNESNKYMGTFDGNNHTISGLYFNDENTNRVGLFGYNSGTIKNVGIIDSYFKGKNYIGGVCGSNVYGKIENSYNTGSVSGSGSVGGVCGRNQSGTIENSYNTGSVSGSGWRVGGVCGVNSSKMENSYNTGSVSGASSVGGVCGYNYYGGTIKNSYNTGSVSGSEDVGGVCGYNSSNSTITNSYYNNSVYSGKDVGSNNGTVNKVSEKTSEQFESGEVAYLLGGIWGQKIGTDKLPVLNSENKVYKVTIYSILENEISSFESYINSLGTVTAPIKEGYNFKGWYTYDESNDNHYTGDVICSSREYNNSNVTADSKIVAVYTSLGTASITINCDREYTINGVSKSSATTESYPIGSKITLSCDNADFAYWQNNAGTILSRESEYSFVVTGKETISAVFNEIVDNKVTLIFESFYGQVIATKQLANGETIDIKEISVPVRTGYNALGWDFDGDGKITENDTLKNAIERGFESDSRTVRIVQVYELINENHKITVENGTGSGTYNQNDIVTAVADEAKTGMKFSHWEDADNNILSYNKKYVFYVSEDLTIKAVYVETATKVNAKGTTSIVGSNRIEIDKEKGKLSFVSMSTVPEGCKINKAGIIATNKSEVANSGEFTDKSAMFVRGMSSDKKAVRYTWTKGNVKSGEIWYVRAYLVYTDSNGNVHTVYGDMVSQEY